MGWTEQEFLGQRWDFIQSILFVLWEEANEMERAMRNK